MPPVRRSTRRKRLKVGSAKEEEAERCMIRVKKRRETLPPGSSSLRMLQELPSMISGILSDDADLQLHSTTDLLKILSVEHEPPIDQVIQYSGALVPRLIQFLLMDDANPQLQNEAARLLKNITAGTSQSVKTVIDHGAVPVFVKLLDSPSDLLREQAASALGNIAGDSPTCRDLVLTSGALSPLLTHLEDHTKLSLLRTGTWALSNLCEGTPRPPFEQFLSAIPVLESLLVTNDEAVLTEAFWALSYLCLGCGQKYPDMLATISPKIGDLLGHPSRSVVFPAIRTLESIFMGADSLLEKTFDCGVGFQLLNIFVTAKDRNCIAGEAYAAYELYRAQSCANAMRTARINLP